jgi:hypothetical protein
MFTTQLDIYQISHDIIFSHNITKNMVTTTHPKIVKGNQSMNLCNQSKWQNI